MQISPSQRENILHLWWPLGGGGGLKPKSPNFCAPKIAQIDISFCNISLFPAMKSGSEGGGGLHPPAPPLQEMLTG